MYFVFKIDFFLVWDQAKKWEEIVHEKMMRKYKGEIQNAERKKLKPEKVSTENRSKLKI